MECVYRSARELYIVTFSEARIRLNVINRQTGEYLRTEYVPLPSAVSSTPAPAASFQRQLLQFEVINATILNGAVMGATSILLPFSGVSEDILIIPYGVGLVQFYQISSGVQVLLQTTFYEIVDAGIIEGIDNIFVIAAVVGNASVSHWEVALCDNNMPTSVNTTLVPLSTFYSRYGAYVASVCASCTPTKVFGDGDLIVMLFASAGIGMYLTRMSANATVPAYNDSMTTDSMEPYFAMQYFYGSVCDVTATIIDDYASVGYFAMTCGSDPSVIMKFRLSTCYVTGIIALSRVGTDAVTVVRMSIDQSLRMLQVLTPLSRSQQMQKVSLYAVSELTPLLADTKGGTLITVTGEGFISGMTCVFNSVTTTPAIFIDQTSLICVAPPGGTVSCAGEPVEVNLAGAGSTNNAQLLQRVASASIREVINNMTDEALGFLSGSFVTVRGSGFILPSNVSLLLCKLYSPTDLSATSITVVATLISSYEVLCVLPPVPGPVPKPSYLEVSIDGTVFSDSLITYDVVGTPSSLFISAPLSGELTVRAARLTQLPAVYVNVADSVSHPLGIYTNSTHLIQATTASGSTFQLLGTTLLNTSSGLATFSNLSILDPSTGTVQITFNDVEHQWNAYLYFTVVEGEPYQMYFVRYPSNATTNINPTLSIQPVVGILDASGNPLTSLTDKSVDIKTITLEYWYHDLNDQVVVRVVAVSALNAQFRVEGVSITGKHEEPYYLNFSSDLLPVPVLISDAIVVGWCETTEFAIANSTACEACPANAVCDGTFEIRAQDNWWRADNTTLVFYSCGAPYSGDSCYDNGECRPGYSGPRCSLCEQGFGKSGRFCEKCQSSDTNNAIVLIACVALLCLVTLMVYTIVMTSSKDLVPVLFRNLVTYIQILARLSDTNMPWPATLDDLWRFISSIANLQAIDFSPFDCAMKVNFFEKYIVTLLIPWFMIVLVAPLAIIVVKLYTKEDETTATALDVAAACRKEEDESLLHEITEATAQRRVTMIGEPSRRFPASNPLDTKQADVLSPGLASVLHNDVLKAVAEGEARKRLIRTLHHRGRDCHYCKKKKRRAKHESG
ncbi:transmembrane protein, putative [Bodo saltans]|uniref:Transmembrane protein, putative n=1 Tax=Bodo saltans TaxID=75058 RepID=A0A0S4J517_BODSA|nr:transmembrane protein, putative [Bodo saltans]|eukprot:CUG51008.1 transmembrane protein, putative [Bodo saltans]